MSHRRSKGEVPMDHRLRRFLCRGCGSTDPIPGGYCEPCMIALGRTYTPAQVQFVAARNKKRRR
jgi:hypothetical protein